MRFSSTNLCTETATTLTASSANPNFPVSNLKNQHRSKRWRSSGSYVIDAVRNTVNFKESAMGSELTCVVPDGSYTATTLATALKAALESVGAETYTVTYSTTTGLWTISTSGTYLKFLNLTGSDFGVSIIVNVLGFTQADTDGSTSHTGSRIAIHTSERIVFDFKTAQDIKNVVLLWPKEDGITLSPQASLLIELNATNVWDSPAVSQAITIDETYKVASHFFETAQSYRYGSVVIIDPQNANLRVELGIVWIGEDLGIQPPENGFDFTLTDNTKKQVTDFGQQYADIFPKIAQLSFDYKYMLPDDLETLEACFRENGSYKPVLVVFDEEELVFAKDHYLIYGVMDKSFKTKHVSYNLTNTDMKITEIG